MKWSWRIARIAGIDLYVHVTFLILVGWVALSHYLARQSAADAFTGWHSSSLYSRSSCSTSSDTR